MEIEMTNILIISENRKARHDYSLVKTFEAGLVLTGSEVKSIREKKVQLKDSYILFKGQEAYWMKGHISEYKASSYNNHTPERSRKLLLNRSELNHLRGAIEQKGMTCVPLKIYFKGGVAKLEIALVEGKDKGDKRQDLKAKDAKREIERVMKKSR
jgi:SsrA-binding protein